MASHLANAGVVKNMTTLNAEHLAAVTLAGQTELARYKAEKARKSADGEAYDAGEAPSDRHEMVGGLWTLCIVEAQETLGGLPERTFRAVKALTDAAEMDRCPSTVDAAHIWAAIDCVMNNA